jgi:hypothetical protein
MDNYKNTFLKKIQFILNMVTAYGFYRIPKDWWDIATTKTNLDPKKQQVHEYGTVFVIERLDQKYNKEYQEILKKCFIKVKEDNVGIYYQLKQK